MIYFSKLIFLFIQFIYYVIMLKFVNYLLLHHFFAIYLMMPKKCILQNLCFNSEIFFNKNLKNLLFLLCMAFNKENYIDLIYM